MKIALVQMNANGTKEENIRKALAFTRKALARKAKFVLLPEYFYFRGEVDPARALPALAEPVNGPTVKLFAALARRHKAFILLGSIYEKAPGRNKAYNTAVLLGPDGKTRAVFRKRNLFHLRTAGREVREGRVFLPSPTAAARPVKLGPFSLGAAVCFDLRFPEIFEACARQGANVFAVPAAFSYMTGSAHWEVLLRARAAETFSYILAVNQCGTNAQGARAWGHSMVVDPWGRIIVEASGSKEEIVMADIDLQEVKKIRSMFPNYKRRNN